MQKVINTRQLDKEVIDQFTSEATEFQGRVAKLVGHLEILRTSKNLERAKEPYPLHITLDQLNTDLANIETGAKALKKKSRFFLAKAQLTT